MENFINKPKFFYFVHQRIDPTLNLNGPQKSRGGFSVYFAGYFRKGNKFNIIFLNFYS